MLQLLSVLILLQPTCTGEPSELFTLLQSLAPEKNMSKDKIRNTQQSLFFTFCLNVPFADSW